MPYFYVLSGGRTPRNDLQINPKEVYACSAIQPWTQGSANFALAVVRLGGIVDCIWVSFIVVCTRRFAGGLWNGKARGKQQEIAGSAGRGLPGWR